MAQLSRGMKREKHERVAAKLCNEQQEDVMRKSAEMALAVAAGLVLTISATFASDVVFSGFLGPPAVYQQLKPVHGGGGKLRWFKPGVDFKKYNTFMVDSVVFYLADKAQYKGIDPQQMKDLADSFNQEIANAFKDKYPIVAEAAPDVARIRIAITNIQPSKPGVSAVTSIVPIGLGVSLVRKGATGAWTGGGETGGELMILDSTTNEIIALAVDQQQAAFEDRFSTYGFAGEAFKHWSERIVLFIDTFKGIKREPRK
jgi:hypothetical protein